ncbi:MAG: N-acetylmuramoyl-L-alanine amidase, partial [Caldimicrobium sp.]
IAKRYGVKEEDIIKWNSIKKGEKLLGKTLIIKIPSEDKSPARVQSQKSEVSPSHMEEIVHVVKKGETLKKIAQRYGVSEREIMQWNDLKSPNLKIGQKLIIKKPQAESDRKKPSLGRRKEIIYKVNQGETLSQIANLFGVKEEDIIKANNLQNKTLKAGQRLIIPITEGEDKKTEEQKVSKDKTQSIEGLFEELQRKEENLRKGKTDRRAYLRLISEYRYLYLMYPGSPIAPLALLKTGELYLELYSKSLRKEDALEAAKRFELFLKNYPEHEKAQVAYKSILDIYERELKDEEKAKFYKERWGKKFPEVKIQGKTPQGDKQRIEKPKNELISKRESSRNIEKTILEKEEKLFLVADLKKVLKIEPITGEDYTRIIIDLSGNFEYQANILSPQEDKPPRLYVDIYPAILGESLQRAFDIQDKHLQRIRVGQFDRQTVRVVLDMQSLSDYKIFKVKEPSQLIIDLIGKEKKKKEKLVKEKTETPIKEAKERKSRKTKEEEKEKEVKDSSYINLARQFGLGVRRIMLDPGHGGEDPGALGPNGLKEKDVVLKLAKLIEKKLTERLPEVEILYTRTSDVFIPLAKRPALANSMKADLFISLHLNASPDPNAKGIETYYLNFTTDPESMRVAALENRANEKSLADLQDLVKAILANTKLNESKMLAEKVQRELVRHLSYHYPGVEDRGVKYAPFLVLVGTRMPAILVEADFITNPVSAERLTKEEYLEKIAEGIAKGIENYIQSLKFSGVAPFEKRRSKTGS